MFIFPFLKELFIGKDNNTSRSGKAKPRETNYILRQVIILLGCASVALNFYLIGRSYSLGRENLELQKQIKEPTPKPVQYPEDVPAQPPRRPNEVIATTVNKNNNNRNKKVINMPPALPPDRESYLKELEEINKIY